MILDGKILVGSGSALAELLPKMANRHGLIAGATGTGKTVTLKVIAEGFSDIGVPVFVSDVKGDLAGMTKSGEHTEAIQQRLEKLGVSNFSYKPYPTIFWDVYGEKGHPVRATISEMGPMLLSRMLRLNDTQSGVLNLLFRVADDEGMLLLDIKDLKAMLAYIGANAKDYTLQYGNVSTATIGAIQRAVALLEDQGGDQFFGEPAFDIADWMQVDEEGRGVVNILAAEKLFLHPVMYSTFLLWLLTELYEALPEQGDLDKPRMVFFFDEAHLLFNECPRALMEKVEQVIRLVRSKGVGVYFITQNPADVPMTILGQLGNRVQHALRAYTPLDQKAVRVAADTFRANPAFDTAEAITQLGTGEALVSFLDEKGAPGVVDRCTILPPQSYMGAIDDTLRKTVIETSPFYGKYENMIDRESAYEKLASAFGGGRATAETTTARVPQVGGRYAPAAPVTPIGSVAPVGTPAAPVAPPQAQDVPIASYEPVAQAGPAQVPVQAYVSQPQAAPQAAPQQPTYLVFDPVTGQYKPLNPTPATPTLVPQQPTAVAQPAPQAVAQPVAQPMTVAQQRQAAAAQKQAEKEAKEAARLQRESEAAARRERTDELRETREKRAAYNSSIVGRLANSAISSVGRTVGSTLTRNLLGIFTRK